MEIVQLKRVQPPVTGVLELSVQSESVEPSLEYPAANVVMVPELSLA